MKFDRVTYFTVALVLSAVTVRGHGQPALSPPYACTTTTTMCQPGGDAENPHVPATGSAAQGRPGKRGGVGQKGVKGVKGDPCQCDVADEEAMEEIRKKMENLEAENLKIKSIIKSMSDAVTPANCTEAAKLNGTRVAEWVRTYPFKAIGGFTPRTVYCSGDEWIVIQRRTDGTVNFYRDWDSYATGFGDKNEEFWLGLHAIHYLTSEANYNKLRIDLRFKDGSVKYAEYSSFSVDDEGSGFRLQISGLSENTEDRMKNHDGQRFSTKDRDNDQGVSFNCAEYYVGAWWYNACYKSNLNGRYNDHFAWPAATLLSFSEMKIARA